VIFSRAQRAHSRLSWQERLTRNAQYSAVSQVTIKLFGIPESFAISLGLATACFLLQADGVLFLGQTCFSEWRRVRLFSWLFLKSFFLLPVLLSILLFQPSLTASTSRTE
jgi:hypothetical protein